MQYSTIREILVHAAEKFGDGDAVRYKLKKDVVESKSYTRLKADSESFSRITSVLIGFAIWPFIPALIAFSRSSSKAFAVIATIGIFAHFGSFNVRISLVAVYPSIFIHEDQIIASAFCR